MARTPKPRKLALLPASGLVVACLTAGMAMPASGAPAPTVDPSADSRGLILGQSRAPTVTADHATAVARSAFHQAEDLPFLFSYTFNGHLKVAGGDFTIGGEVYLAVKLNNGTVRFRTNVLAHTHPITPGGAIYVETTIAAPCAPGNNGYARAYDYTTGRWSPRLPVAICQIID